MSGLEASAIAAAGATAEESTVIEGWLEPPQPQDLVIDLLGSYVRGRLESVWSGGLVQLLAEFGFSTGASRVALARLARRDLISRVKTGRLVSYRITTRTERLMAEGDKRIFQLGLEEPTDGRMTVLWHTLPEERRLERGRMARRLRFLGFGSVQDSTWIAPGNRERDVASLIEDLQVGDYCSVLVGKASERLGLRPLVERAWDLGALEERYRAFIELFGPYSSATARRALSDAEAFRVRTQCIYSFRTFASLDPSLPKSLAPGPSSRSDATQLFAKVYHGLTAASLRHFDRVIQSGDVG